MTQLFDPHRSRRLAVEIERLSGTAGPLFSGLMRLALLELHEPSAHSLGQILAPGAKLAIMANERRTMVYAVDGETTHTFDVGPAPMHRARAIIAGAIALREKRSLRKAA